MVLEGQVAYYLNAYLGDYLSGLDANALKISVLAGDVTLSNLQLKPEALNRLGLPFVVQAGLLGELRLKVSTNILFGRVVAMSSACRSFDTARDGGMSIRTPDS